MSDTWLTSRDVTPNELILASGSLRGIAFEERVEAAESAGFGSVGLHVREFDRLVRSGTTPQQMQKTLRHNGVRLAKLEVVVGFAFRGARMPKVPYPGVRHTDDETLSRCFDMAESFGARHLQVVGTFGADVLEDDAAEKFAGLCDRCAEHGLLVALEFMPTTNVPDAGIAADVVRVAGRSNGGICVDVWHHVRGANDLALLSKMPVDRVFVIQIGDGTIAPTNDDYIVDSLTHRVPPGRGDFDVAGFVHQLEARGIRAPISVEVLTGSGVDMPARLTADVLGRAARDVLASARSAT